MVEQVEMSLVFTLSPGGPTKPITPPGPMSPCHDTQNTHLEEETHTHTHTHT